MIVKTAENVYDFVKQSINIKEEIENVEVQKKNSSPVNTQKIDLKNNLVKYNLDYSKFENCIKQADDEEAEKEKLKKEEEKLNRNNQNSCSHDHSKERQLYEKTTEEKLRASNAFNEEGKQAFHEKNYKLACVFFRKGLIQLDYCFPETEKEIEEHTKLEINLHLNMALTKFHMENFYECINNCSTVLNLDKNNAKAHYRKGHAYMSLDLYKEAKEHLLKACELNPNDSNIKKSLVTLKRKMEIYNRRNKSVCMKIFSSEKDVNSKQEKDENQNKKEKMETDEVDIDTTSTEVNKTNYNSKNDGTKEKNENRKLIKTDEYNQKNNFNTCHILKNELTQNKQLHESGPRSRKQCKSKELNLTENNMKCRIKIPLLLFLKHNAFLFFFAVFLILLFFLLFFSV